MVNNETGKQTVDWLVIKVGEINLSLYLAF